jgi:hypothetical protein
MIMSLPPGLFHGRVPVELLQQPATQVELGVLQAGSRPLQGELKPVHHLQPMHHKRRSPGSATSRNRGFFLSGGRESNPQPRAWEGHISLVAALDRSAIFLDISLFIFG